MADSLQREATEIDKIEGGKEEKAESWFPDGFSPSWQRRVWNDLVDLTEQTLGLCWLRDSTLCLPWKVQCCEMLSLESKMMDWSKTWRILHEEGILSL